MKETAEKDAKAIKFEELDEYDKVRYVIAVMLSAFKLGTRIYERRSDGCLSDSLDRQVSDILFKHADEQGKLIIRGNFLFESYSKYSNQVYDVFHDNFGQRIGLNCLGMDFDFEVTQKTHEIADEARQYLPKEEIVFLRGLGRKIKKGRK